MENPSPSTSGRPLVTGMEVVRTPQGRLLVSNESVLLERSNSGRLRPWNPQNILVSDDIEVVEPRVRPRTLFPTNEDEDNIFDAPLAEALHNDSGSDEEEVEELTEEDLLQILTAEEEEEQENFQDLNWTANFETFEGVQEQFNEEAGPKIEGTTPSGLFTQLWDQPLMEIIVNETNKYAWQTIAPVFEVGDLPPHSRMHQWAETTVAELYKLIAILIFMGICVRGRIDEYWLTGVLGMPGFRTLMSKDRFLLLMRFLHFADNDTVTAHGTERKVAKIAPILDYLNKKFKAAYTPHREISIDESLLLWKGHLSWIQCIRSKAARFGIKTYELCEAVSGYVVSIILYTGKGSTTAAPMYGFTSCTAKVVLTLMKEYLNKGYNLFMDNFYNSISLTRFLKKHKTDVVGTLNRRRVDVPQDIKDINEKRMARGNVVSRHCGDVSVVSWKDVKLVTTVSTYHNADMAPGFRAGQDCPKPKVVHDYNKFMGGVDLKDQKLASYLLERKRGLKWYIKVFRRLLNTSILNAYIIYCSNIGQNKKLTHRQFRIKLAEELCAQFGGGNIQPRTRQSNPCARLDKFLDHYPEHSEVTQERAVKDVRYKRGRCVRCASRKERKQTNIICSQCKVFLCIGQCFREFHTLENL